MGSIKGIELHFFQLLLPSLTHQPDILSSLYARHHTRSLTSPSEPSTQRSHSIYLIDNIGLSHKSKCVLIVHSDCEFIIAIHIKYISLENSDTPVACETTLLPLYFCDILILDVYVFRVYPCPYVLTRACHSA